MCDESDKNQELLEKLSRQLSELTSTNNQINEVLAPDIGSRWAQSSGLPSEEHPSSFSPLYTWDPAFLQASPTGSSPHLSSPGFHAQGSPTASSFPIPSPGHNLSANIGSWSPLSTPQDFHVLGDLSGRFSNAPKSPATSQQDYNLIGNSHTFHESNTPIVGRSFVPEQPNELFSNLASVIGRDSPSLSAHHHNFDIHSAPVNSHHIQRDCLDSFHNANNPSDLINHTPYFESPPSFDPSTPPPPFQFQRHISDTPDQLTTEPLAVRNEFLDYLRLQSEPIDLNLGTNIGGSDSWQAYSRENEDTSTSEQGKLLYTDALNKWNSFDFTGIDSSDTSEDFTLSQKSQKEESLSESAGQDLSKPSYSDIAKTPKITPTATSRVEHASSDTASKTQFVSKDGKPYRPLIQRTISASKFWPKANLDGNVDQPKVSPTSRYGLDSFEDDDIHSPGNLDKHCDSLGNVTRTKRSGSCAGALDNLSLEMTGQNITGGDGDASVQEVKASDKANQKTKPGMADVQSKISTPSSVKMPTASSPASKSEEKLFFDPKRIFQPKNTNKSRAQSPTQRPDGKSNANEKPLPGETVLNNGKPTTTSSSFKLPTAARQHDYINNDLRDANKVTNKTAAESLHPSAAFGKNEELHSKHKEPSRPPSGRRSGSGRVNGSYHREKRKVTGDDPNFEYADAQNGHRYLPANVDLDKLEEWFSVALEKLTLWGHFLWMNARTFLVYTLGLILFLSCGAYQLARYLVVKGWTWMMNKIYTRLGKKTNEDSSWKSRDSARRRIGLEENIALPSTGEEAMRRLLACNKGKDPYSILGVRQDSSDEDIKKYYRKQAVLVHPDKNQEPGAEEAFKILGHAFEKIGEPSKRKEYDNQALVESESDLRKEFSDLITKLQTKIQEAANLMPCDNCGNKHRRIPVDRPIYSARFCQKCDIRHSAKEGDVWAESTMLGFYWNYYALMEGHVYDITEWMKCHHEFYKRMRANEHTVLTRIATDGNKKTKHHQSREANLDDFINHFFPKTPGHAGGAASQTNGGQPHSGAEPGWGQASYASAGSSSAAAAAAARKAGGGRRKKKRH